MQIAIVAIILSIIQNIINMQYLGSSLKDFRYKTCIALTSAINTFLIFYNIFSEKDLYISYILSYFIIFVEFKFFSKAKAYQCMLATGLYIINGIMVQLLVIAFMSSYLQLPFKQMLLYTDLRIISVLFMFFIGILSMIIIIKLIPRKDLKILVNNQLQCIIVAITCLLFISGLIIDSLMLSYDGWFTMQSAFLIVTIITFFIIILNTISNGVRISKLAHFENRLQSLEEEYKESSVSAKKLKNLAFRDNLTGCYTRKYIMDYIDDTLRQDKYPFCISYIDLNKLKYVNDTFGHNTGDEYIKDISTVFFHGLRKSDLISRVGGDEFIVVLPNTKKESASMVMERISNNLKHLQDVEQRKYKMAFSYGIYEANGNRKLTREQMIEEADKIMYEMKCKSRKYDGDIKTVCDDDGCLI